MPDPEGPRYGSGEDDYTARSVAAEMQADLDEARARIKLARTTITNIALDAIAEDDPSMQDVVRAIMRALVVERMARELAALVRADTRGPRETRLRRDVA